MAKPKTARRWRSDHPRKIRQHEMVTSYVLGMTIRQVATIYGVSTNTVHYALQMSDTPRRPSGTWKKLDPLKVAEIYAKWESGGHTVLSLAQAYGVSDSYMSRLLRRQAKGN